MSIEENDLDVNIPSDPAARKKIFAAVKAASDDLTIIEGYREKMKEDIKSISEEFEIKKKYITKLVSTYHKANFNQQQAENETLGDLYEAVVGENGQ